MGTEGSPRRTSLYLDVDGVVGAEAFDLHPSQETGWLGEWRVRKVGPYSLRYSEELVQALNDIAALPGVTVIFASSWEDHAPEFLPSVIGLGGRYWASLSGVECDSPSWWWKLDAVRADAAARAADRIVWVDDELRKIPEAAAAVQGLCDGILTVSPDPRHGLTASHIRKIQAFIEEA